VNVSMLKESSLTAEQSTGLDEIASAAGRAANLTRQPLTFSRRHRPNPTVLDLNDLVANVTRMLQRVIGEHISLTAHYAPGAARVHADRGMIEQALMNLAINARDAMPKGGRMSIGTEIVAVDEHAARANPRAYPGTFVRLRVSDTGHGIPSDILPRIFEPFFTTKGVGHGTGLGLAIVFGIVDQHRGWIETDSRVGEGTTFRLYLPAATAPLAENAQGGGDRPELRGTETVLLVEDEPSLRSALQKVLEQHGYRVLQASTAREALEVWRREEQKIHLLLTDVVMPDEVTGRELADRLHAEAPGLKVIYASGHSDEVLPDGSALRGSPDFIEKPFMPEDLLRKVRDRLDRR
jgi:CheY-like chemotaxis protein